MKQTPINRGVNEDLLAIVPQEASRIVEVGCSGGGMARAVLNLNPRADYIGIEIDADYAEAARAHCTSVLVDNIEHMSDAVFDSLFPSDCWIFGDVLEHLYDPWSVLQANPRAADTRSSVVACIPNAQHWSVQARLNCGVFRYEDSGLMDRTHIRWFTRTTIEELFRRVRFLDLDGAAG